MELLRKEFEKIALGLGLLALIVATAILAYMLSHLNPSSSLPIPTGNRGVAPLDEDKLDALVAKAQHPPRMDVRPTSDPVTDDPFCAWLQSHNLPCKDDSAGSDPDGDQFTNQEEFVSGTDPTDAKSYPALDQLLNLDRLVRKEFPLRFRGYIRSADGRVTVKLNQSSLDHTYYGFVGGVLETADERYLVQQLAPHFVEEFDSTLGGMRTREESRLTLCRLSDDAVIELMLGQITYLPKLGAVVTSKLENRTLEAVAGLEFLIRGKQIKVTEIGADSITVEDERGTHTLRLSRN